MKNIFALIIVGTLALSPMHTSFAAKDTTTTALYQQLTAISSYITRTFTEPTVAPSKDTLRTAIKEGVSWIQNTQEESGHFAYEYAPYEGEYLEGEQMVRQAGTLYSLGEIERRQSTKDAALEETIEAALHFFEELSKEGEYDGTSFRCIADSTSSTRCQLGATSLALVGLISHLTVYPEKEEMYGSLLTDWYTYILNSQKENGGFRNVYRHGNTFQSEAESPFSNGEALLALVRTHIYVEDIDATDAIDRAFLYLKDEPYDTALYLWIMAALKDLQKHEPNEAYVTYTRDFTDWRVERVQRFKGTNKNYCAYSEGVVSAYSILENTLTNTERQALLSEIGYWNAKNLRLQITENDHYRVHVQDNTLSMDLLPDPTLALGGFLTSEDVATQRIDFTQHCITALAQTLVDVEGGEL